MKYEIQQANPLDFINESPFFKVGDRNFYKCTFKINSMIKGSVLNYTDLFYITRDYNDKNSGAYLCINYDDNRENILFFEYLRKPNEDMESIEYVILEFLKKTKYDINSFKKSDDGYKYYNNIY